ncbi:MLP-like protein 28 [Hibiscus syriacus]|uniref:MLP-like protein 28 n=1 Tax=Hibiscus syriacus TaxID=106335 RepID=A0A6A3BSL2_HIBSY|nr:MLP-like protein 28 [Hibiscus syriacus]
MSSALTGKLEADVEINASPDQFHDMVANRPHHLHHASYDKIQACDLHEGEWWKVGTVVIFRYAHGMILLGMTHKYTSKEDRRWSERTQRTSTVFTKKVSLWGYELCGLGVWGRSPRGTRSLRISFSSTCLSHFINLEAKGGRTSPYEIPLDVYANFHWEDR